MRMLCPQSSKRLTDTDVNRRRVRRAVHLSELATLTGLSPASVEGLLEKFRGEGRNFVTFEPTGTNADPLVQISHESLIRQWGRLKDWVDDEADSRDRFLELVDRARNRRALLQDPDLEYAVSWRKRAKPTPAWASRYSRDESDFTEAMNYLDESERAIKLDQLRDRTLNAARLSYLVPASCLMQAAFEDLHNPLFAGFARQEYNLATGAIFAIVSWFVTTGSRLAFQAGIMLYGIDTVCVVLAATRMPPEMTVLSLGFHAWLLFGLVDGLRASSDLSNLGQARPTAK